MADLLYYSAFFSTVVRSIIQSWPRQELSIGTKRKQCVFPGWRYVKKKTNFILVFLDFLSFLRLVFRLEIPQLHVR